MVKKIDMPIGRRISFYHNDIEVKYLSLFQLPTIIGLTGPTKSGKTIVARRMVAQHGFKYINLSSYIRLIATNLGAYDQNWKQLSKLARQIRNEQGCDILARWAIRDLRQDITSGLKVIIDGILHPSEVIFFRQFKKFHLIAMIATEKVRFNQAKRWYPDDYASIEDFRERDIYEQVKKSNNDKLAPNIKKCIHLSDNRIIINKEFNYKSIEKKTDLLISSIITTGENCITKAGNFG